MLGNRELDQRNRAGMLDVSLPLSQYPAHTITAHHQSGDDDDEGQKGGVASSIDGYFDTNIDWSTLEWLKARVHIALVLFTPTSTEPNRKQPSFPLS